VNAASCVVRITQAGTEIRALLRVANEAESFGRKLCAGSVDGAAPDGGVRNRSAHDDVYQLAGNYDHVHNLLAVKCGLDFLVGEGALTDYLS
jgi:hypothetical protein